MNLSQAATAVGVSRQRIRQIAVKKGIGTATPSKRSGERQRWHFSQEEIQRMQGDHIDWLSVQTYRTGKRLLAERTGEGAQ